MKKLYLMFLLFFISLTTSFAKDNWIFVSEHNGTKVYRTTPTDYAIGMKMFKFRLVKIGKVDLTMLFGVDCAHSRYMLLGEPEWKDGNAISEHNDGPLSPKNIMGYGCSGIRK